MLKFRGKGSNFFGNRCGFRDVVVFFCGWILGDNALEVCLSASG